MKNIIRTLSLIIALVFIFSLPIFSKTEKETDPETGLEYTANLVSEEKDEEVILHESEIPELYGTATPAIYSTFTEKEKQITPGDIYVSPSGNDSNPGTFDLPVNTFAKAVSMVEEMMKNPAEHEGGITVSFMAGTYPVSSTVKITSASSGTRNCPVTYTSYGDGEVIFKSSLSLSPNDFVPADNEFSERFKPEAKNNIYMLDLKPYGVDSSALRYKMIGTETFKGTNVELAVDREVYQLAKYPNGDKRVKAYGLDENNKHPVIIMTEEDASVAKTWAPSDDIIAIANTGNEWNDSASKVTFDLENNSFTMTGVSKKSGDSNMPYCFFNVPEELDSENEWYLDRENCILYAYHDTPLDGCETELALYFDGTMLNMNDTQYVTVDGFTFMGTKGGGITVNNVMYDNILNCRLYNIGGDGISGSGYYTTIQANELEYLGGKGISFGGGEKATLKKADILIDNNLITHWGLNRKTFTGAIDSTGQGITISHNEICHAIGHAGGLGGNLNAWEYNLIYDCTKWASDQGTFYNGSSWTSGSCDIRYNIIFNTGGEDKTPQVLYWDDGMAYQRAYGNLIVNGTGDVISMGGGFANVVVNNIFIGYRRYPYWNDGRAYFGYHAGDSFYGLASVGFLWNLYQSTPYSTRVWKENFPLLNQILQNKDDEYAAHFAYNPAYCLYTDNVFINDNATPGAEAVHHVVYGVTLDNYVGYTYELEDLFVDPMKGDYRIKKDSRIWDVVGDDFEEIPYSEIGRY